MSSRDRSAQQPERIVVERNENGFSIDYRGEDPDTRFVPRERSLLERVVDRVAIGIHGPERLRSLGR